MKVALVCLTFFALCSLALSLDPPPPHRGPPPKVCIIEKVCRFPGAYVPLGDKKLHVSSTTSGISFDANFKNLCVARMYECMREFDYRVHYEDLNKDETEP